MLKKSFITIFSLLMLGAFFFNCDTGVEMSPAQGTIRVTFQSDPADTTIEIVEFTFSVSEDDWFGATIFQGKVYNDDQFALLYTSTKSYLLEDVTYNILERENNEYEKFTIFESYVPPGDYNLLQFGVTAEWLELEYFGIPVELPEGADLLVDMYHDFHVSENKVTEINVQISPFKSVVRYRDTFHFTREMEITGVTYY